MNCDFCVSDDCDEVWADAVTVNEPLPHSTKCIECYESIPAGTTLQITTGWPDQDEDGNPDGESETYHTCLGCAQIRAAYSCGVEVYCDFWERFWDSNDPAKFKMAGDCWDQLRVEGKTKMVHRWKKEVGL